MAVGPVSILAIQFDEGNFTGEILTALIELVDSGVVRVIDAVAVLKDANGNVESKEIKELAPAVVSIFDPLNAEVSGLLSYTDIQNIGDMLDENSAAGLLVLEHTWAEKLANAIVHRHGKVVLNQLLLPDVVEENLAAIAAVQ